MRKHRLKAWGLPRLIAQVYIEYPDGSIETIDTDSSWKVTANGPIRSNNEYDGEIYDASKDLGAWTEVGYDDSEWSTAVLMKAPKRKLVAQRSPSLKVMERIKPISIRKVDSNRYIVDMGQDMAGIEQVKLTGKKGHPIKMRFSEVLKTDDDSQLYVDNLRTALVEDVYVPNSDSTFNWRPEFVYHGYRFMEISGVTEQPDVDDIEGLVIYDDMQTTGSFSCSNEILNRLHQNAYWSIRGNYTIIEVCLQIAHKEMNVMVGWEIAPQVHTAKVLYLTMHCFIANGSQILRNLWPKTVVYPMFLQDTGLCIRTT